MEKRLLRFITAKLHKNHRQFAMTVTRVLCTELSVQPSQLVCISRDSVSVNGATCRLLTQSTFALAEDLLCISHTLSNVGERIQFNTLKEFFTPWLELVGGRNPHRGAQRLWRETVAPRKVSGYSNTRWYCSAEIQFVLAECFDQLPDFLSKLDALGYGDATRQKMHSVLDSSAN